MNVCLKGAILANVIGIGLIVPAAAQNQAAPGPMPSTG